MHKALREARGLEAESASDLLQRAGLSGDVRPETVEVNGFVRLFQAINDSGALA